MSRKQRKKLADGDSVVGSQGAENLGLKPPFGAAPTRPGNYCLYVAKGRRQGSFVLNTPYAIKKFLDILLEDDEVSLVKGLMGEEDTLMSTTGITVRLPRDYGKIEELFKHEYTEDEAQWELGEPTTSQAVRLRHASDSDEPTEATTTTPGVERPKREKKEKVVRPSKEGLVTIGEIAAELKIEARDARAALRKAKVEKPTVGWAWEKKEVDNIKEIIQNNNE